jgi:hypothetical protein
MSYGPTAPTGHFRQEELFSLEIQGWRSIPTRAIILPLHLRVSECQCEMRDVCSTGLAIDHVRGRQHGLEAGEANFADGTEQAEDGDDAYREIRSPSSWAHIDLDRCFLVSRNEACKQIHQSLLTIVSGSPVASRRPRARLSQLDSVTVEISAAVSGVIIQRSGACR